MSDAPELTSATDLVARLRSGELGSEELLDLQLERIGRLDGELNAVVALDVEGRARGARGRQTPRPPRAAARSTACR